MLKGVHLSLSYIFDRIKVNKKHRKLGKERYEGYIGSACVSYLMKIREIEQKIKQTKLSNATKYLIINRNEVNNDLLGYLLDARRGKRE